MISKLTTNYLSLREAAMALEDASYTFAKSMPRNPHWYTLSKNWDRGLFEDIVRFIRRYGYTEYFWGKPYIMYTLNGFKFWTMGAPIPETILINRAVVTYTNDYDKIADWYDTSFRDEDSKKENEELFKILDIKGKVLDVGCGNGLFLEYNKISVGDYFGIDPSRKMLEHLARHFPDYGRRVLQCRAEDFYKEGFDTIVSLFGTPSYINPSAIAKFRDMLTPTGKAYFMYYRYDYNPKTHIETGIKTCIYPNDDIGETVFNHYKLVIYTKNENLLETKRL